MEIKTNDYSVYKSKVSDGVCEDWEMGDWEVVIPSTGAMTIDPHGTEKGE